jgi:DNA-binding CsgD family transcriptional regulator
VTARPSLLDAGARLWESVAEELRGDREVSGLALANGTSVQVRVEPVTDGAEVVGALIRLNPSPSPALIEVRPRPRRGRDGPRFGWASLTNAEHDVAELVAEGLTNAQVGARLFQSRHTVDSHLRRIYRKLDISSRVQLARLVTERALSPLGTAG